MKLVLNQLIKSKSKKKTRVARGPGSKGKTAGRGHKGQKSRSGGKIPTLFEGGQSSFVLRTPKRGFKNYNRVTYDVVNVGLINKLGDVNKIDVDVLVKLKIISGKNPLKILGNGELNKKLDVSANFFSKSAEEKIKSAGGSVTKI
ncbi:MAG: 50S ribosomal protein L15 [Thermodesulfobacteriota bacterium]|nr:50S ribosomal protein L15 [Thermodesulfobacteriota bacterium]